MWRPPINFVSLHYAYIILLGLLSFPILYPDGTLNAVDTYHFGVSASTESGLNTVDLKDLRTYQQLYLYFLPIVTNIGFINIIVVIVRLWWFRKHLKKRAPDLLSARRNADSSQRARDIEIIGHVPPTSPLPGSSSPSEPRVSSEPKSQDEGVVENIVTERKSSPPSTLPLAADEDNQIDDKKPSQPRTHISFDPSTDHRPKNDATLYIPGPRDRDRGYPLIELNNTLSRTQDERDPDAMSIRPGLRRRITDGSRLAESRSVDRAATFASSVFVIGRGKPPRERRNSMSLQQPALNSLPYLSNQATVGRNSLFMNLTSEDREMLGGIEYRSLKLLLKIVIAYFFGLHLFGAICLLPWIKLSDAKYRDYLKECAVSETWWAFYSAQTMFNNLGLTLTPDSMVSFRDAEWPMVVMSFLSFAGNTCYPIFLRLSIWTMSKVLPRNSAIQEPLNFLLEHPRRCYTLLFPSKQTWVLFGILFVLNFVDTLLIIVLDLDNPAVAVLPIGQRILAAIFQAASSRHTGTATFVLSDVNPAVQLSLLVMMYISVFPLAISIRASNTYEERSLGIYEPPEIEVDESESTGASYLLKHMQNQLSFDLWYIFLGVFCLSISESDKIMDQADPAFNLFSILFEVTSAYANVGLSLGYPNVNVSLCGKFTPFGKIVICIMMIRGRHRGLPYELDRAIMLPDEHLVEGTSDNEA
ncbi:unnamed protein product [Clonostachys rosea]|uniref:Potassium transport protein n=1 Tax=Bionectria ochroleuca TaxID=29856 RepID=A0ABY6UE71_BIOOC|nr:unnamed protein product [Clonostachys rosea]